jgi:RNA polymerase sigma-70 factor (ECF subfamily)
MPHPDDAEDAQDIRRVLAGDAGAFRGLIARHARRVHDLARRMLRDAHEAEDAAQQAFVNAFRALDRFDLDRPFRHWLLRITSNLCRNRIAKRKVRAALLSPTGGENVLPEPSARPEAPEAPLDSDLRQAAVQAAIAALPERYRLPVVLFYVHDLPVAEIAEITDTPQATVKTWLHRGRAALREHLGESLLQGPSGDETSPPAAGTED